MADQERWHPGSFTKNFSWGPPERGLRELYEIINLGFAGELTDTSRDDFRQRVAHEGRPEYIPLNFFLFNRVINGRSYIVVDELVFQAITGPHGPRFDRLALFAFNLSYAGKWVGARPGQDRPALWAFRYILDRVARDFDWNTRRISADDIESFVHNDSRYEAHTARKLSTNLNYLYSVGHIKDLSSPRVDRWWVDALFLTLDRVIEHRRNEGYAPPEAQFSNLLTQSGFTGLSGKRSLEKDLATRHLVRLYVECGGRDRFSDEHVKERTALRLPDLAWYIANDKRPQGAVHPTNPRILKSIPRACAMLANYAGFDVVDADELAAFEPDEFIRRHTRAALSKLDQANIRPTMTAEELMRLTRSK